MKLGFVSAILPDESFESVLQIASQCGYDCVEVMCWPVGKAERRYAGVSHIHAESMDARQVERIHQLTEKYQVSISGLGYYPNPLDANPETSQKAVEHIRQCIRATAALGLNQFNTFVGRDPVKSVDENWPAFLATWKPLIQFAEDQGVRVGIENCPMLFGRDEWPGGKNLACSPAIWRRMFSDIPSKNFGLNFDPSHFVLQQMDYLPAIREFAERIFHVHAKDLRIDRHLLNQHGYFAEPKTYHSPKLPGMGDVNWGQFFSVLTDTGYTGPVCVEVEDRAYEGTLERRKLSLQQSATYLRNFVPRLG